MAQRSQPTPKRLLLVNTFGVLGYISLIVQWFWIVLLLGYPLLEDRPELLFPDPSITPSPAPEFGALSPFVTIVVGIFTIVILIVAAILIARMPKSIGEQGARVTHGAAHKLTPVVTRHAPLSPKRRRIISHRIVLAIKAGLLLLPLGLTLFARPVQDVTMPMIWGIAIFCASSTIVYFALQQLIARVAKVKPEKVW